MGEVLATGVWSDSETRDGEYVPAMIQAGTPVEDCGLSDADLNALREAGSIVDEEVYDAREVRLGSTVGASWNALERQRRMIEAGENESVDLEDTGEVTSVNPNSYNKDELLQMAESEGVEGTDESMTKDEIADAINEARQAAE
jgi:hypothetical protein